MKLYDLLKEVRGYEVKTDIPDEEVISITDNSRKIQKGCVFVCIKGASFDGHTKAKEALENGAVAVITEKDMGLERQIVVDNTRDFYGALCASWFGNPQEKITAVGVTGTNGKTTMTNVIKHILTADGHKVGLIGTIQNEIGDEVLHTDNTTPFAYDLMELFAKMVEAGCDYVVMEVSSFGLVQKRTGNIHFKIGVFTNLTQDHLDYHKTMEEYYKAKKMLFDISDIAVCDIDDDYGKRLFSEITCEKYSYSIKGEADYFADMIKVSASGSQFWYCGNSKSYKVETLMTGSFNVANLTGAITVCLKLGVSIEKILEVLKNHTGVKGRCEVIPTGKDFSVICDYAHTPDAIENILSNVKEYTEGRLICLFGCGGNRDNKKRPLMAQAAAKYADMLIVTSDNPRDEKPEAIIDEILVGIKDTKVPYEVVVDRIEAIHHALKIAKKGDVIVLAGKGHEDYQVLANNVHIHLDEREVVAEGLKLI